jgi:hypothetical protein
MIFVLNTRQHVDIMTIYDNICLQQNCALAYNAIVVRLELVFKTNVSKMLDWYLWRCSLTDMVPRFNVIRFFLWGHLKTVVYADPPVSLQDLKTEYR